MKANDLHRTTDQNIIYGLVNNVKYIKFKIQLLKLSYVNHSATMNKTVQHQLKLY